MFSLAFITINGIHLGSYLHIVFYLTRHFSKRSIILTALGLLLLSSCQKEYSAETLGLLSPKDTFMNYLLKNKTFKLDAFYSDVPIDFNPYDTVGPKTDLWQYVRDYLKDDTLVFLPGNLAQIIQGPNLISPGTPPVISVNYGAVPDSTGALLFNFVDYDYQPFTYQLVTFNDTSFTVFIQTPDAKLFTRYRRLF